MGFLKPKRVVNSPLVCLFCKEVDSKWFTKENADAIPTCTTCHLHLVPDSFKNMLASGVTAEDLKLDPPAAITAAFASVTVLWAYLNCSREPIIASSPVSWDVWNSEAYSDWPTISQSSFIDTFGDAAQLGCKELGSLTEHFPYLASICSNLNWREEKDSEETTVSLWPKDAMAVLSPDNYQAFLSYLAMAREPISNQPVWKLIDQLLELAAANPPSRRSKRLFGAEVVVHTIKTLFIQEADEFKGNEEYESKALINIAPGTAIDPFGPDSPKRLFHKLSLTLQMAGPFGLGVKVVSSDLTSEKLTLVHSYSFKLLVPAADPDDAKSQIEQKFFEKFGFTVMQRAGQNWLVDKHQGVDWQPDWDKPIQESPLFSKIMEVKISSPRDWEGTAWQSLCL